MKWHQRMDSHHHRSAYLSLESLELLSDAAAEALAKHEGDLSLDGLTSLSDSAAESLAKLEGDLSLKGLTSLSDVAAEALAKHRGKVSLSDAVNRFAVVDVSSDEWDFSDCSSTEEIISRFEAYIDHLLGEANIPAVTFIDEAGKKKVALFGARDGISIEDADDCGTLTVEDDTEE